MSYKKNNLSKYIQNIFVKQTNNPIRTQNCCLHLYFTAHFADIHHTSIGNIITTKSNMNLQLQEVASTHCNFSILWTSIAEPKCCIKPSDKSTWMPGLKSITRNNVKFWLKLMCLTLQHVEMVCPPHVIHALPLASPVLCFYT